MTTYNPNDFYPRSGAEIDSSGNLKNEADGTNPDGSRNIVIVKHKQTTIQTHNAVSIVASGSNLQSSWMDTDGYDKIAISVLNDNATTTFTASVIYSNDGVNIQGQDVAVLNAVSGTYKSAIVDLKARYAKININNNDSAASHTISAWAYLKA